MRLRRKHSPTTMTFPKGVDTLDEYLDTLGPLGRQAVETRLRAEHHVAQALRHR